MGSLVLDAQLHRIARHLVKVDTEVRERFGGKMNLSTEVKNLNEKYDFVPASQLPAFEREVSQLVAFEKGRVVKSVSRMGYAKFRFDDALGTSSISHMADGLDDDSAGALA